MIIDREDRAVFTHELVNRRLRGRPRVAIPMVRTSVRLPASVFDACCKEALASGRSLAAVVREAVAERIAKSTPGDFTSLSNPCVRRSC